jgi:NAD(P)H-hydrate epimerase
MFPTVTDVPSITTAQMIEVDRVMIHDLSIDLPRMMENAGRNLAAMAIDLFSPASVAVLAGSGGNGGGALVAARHLANRGVAVHVTPTRPVTEMSPVAAHQATILERMGIPMDADPIDAELVVDGLIGYSLSGPPRGRALELIEWANQRQILSLDVPSGVDSTSGAVPGVAVMAAATMTLALPKVGIVGHPNAGRLFLADISVPPSVYATFGISLETPFRESQIVEVGWSSTQLRRDLLEEELDVL